jgi:type IV secretory pathway VirB2 component (pilin)
MRCKPIQFVVTVALALYALSPHAWASTAGAGLPMEGPLDALKNSLTGPIARDVGLGAIVGALGMLIFEGQHMSGFVRGCCFLAMGVGALCNAQPLMNGLGIPGATVLATSGGDELLVQLLGTYGPFAAALLLMGCLGVMAYAVFSGKREGTKPRQETPGRN